MSEGIFHVMDPVHGSIELQGSYLCQIIDTEEFQRLRKIKQLGGACYVYPGANHTRFEHSIGVCFIASELMKHLKDDNIASDKIIHGGIHYEKCVKVAALCHDLGHGPYSHLYDFAVKLACSEGPELERKHEFRSVKIFERICRKLRKKLGKKFEISEKEEIEIGKMITFSEKCKGFREKYLEKKHECDDDMTQEQNEKEKRIKKIEMKHYKDIEQEIKIEKDTFFFYEIVANGFAEIDVDKMDYFIRDGYYLGLSSYFDWRRYIQTLKVLNVGNSKTRVYRLCSRDKEALELHRLFHIRNQLYHQAYRHKTTVAVERMLKEALVSANKNLSIACNGKEYPILEAWKDMDAFLMLNDSIEDIIMVSQSFTDVSSCSPPKSQFCIRGDNAGIMEAILIIEKIKNRDLLKYIDRKRKCCKVDNADFESSIEVDGKRIEGKVIDEQIKFSYGMGEKNPVQEYYFYTKDKKARPDHLPIEDVSEMLPMKYMEEQWNYYYKRTDKESDKRVRKIRESIKQKLKEFECSKCKSN